MIVRQNHVPQAGSPTLPFADVRVLSSSIRDIHMTTLSATALLGRDLHPTSPPPPTTTAQLREQAWPWLSLLPTDVLSHYKAVMPTL